MVAVDSLLAGAADAGVDSMSAIGEEKEEKSGSVVVTVAALFAAASRFCFRHCFLSSLNSDGCLFGPWRTRQYEFTSMSTYFYFRTYVILHRYVSIEMVQCSVCLGTSGVVALVQAFDFVVFPARAFLLVVTWQ